jgi:hypothetical protein
MSLALSTPDSDRNGNKGLHLALWVVQTLLAAGFGMAGLFKLTAPIAELAHKIPWVGQVPAGLVRFIGASELLGAVGLLLPAATRIRPSLTWLAGAGLALVMGLAAAFHLSHGELQALPVNVVLGGMAAFVAWGRRSRAPIRPR